MRRVRIHVISAVVPWLAMLGFSLAAGLWWAQQRVVFRLLALATMTLWTAVWIGMARRREPRRAAVDAGRGRSVEVVLLTLAGILGVLGFDGLAFGRAPFGVGVSAGLMLAASGLAVVARLAGRPAQFRSLTAAISVLIGLSLAEAGIRWLRLGESAVQVDDAYYVRQYHHITPPHTAFLSSPKALDEFSPVLIETNAFGIRGPELPEREVDILAIGDSFIEARQLPWESTLGPRLSTALRARSSTARVASHGVRGWSPLLEWNWYLKAGRRLRARTVLLFFFWNDLWTRGDEVTTFRAVLGPDGRPDHFDVPVEWDGVWYKHVRAIRLAADIFERLSLSLIRRSMASVGRSGAVLDLETAKAAARGLSPDGPLAAADIDALLTQPVDRLDDRLRRVVETEFWPGMRPMSLWTPEQLAAAASSENVLRLFAADVAADGARLVVVYVPNAYQIAPSECAVGRFLVGLDGNVVLPPESGIQTWLRNATGRLGVEFVDPSAAMRDYHREGPAARPLHLRADCHWSEAGHAFLADLLADWFVQSPGSRR